MTLTIATVADFDQFLETFATRGVAKRREHGPKGSRVFRDPDDPNRVSAVFDWEAEGYESGSSPIRKSRRSPRTSESGRRR